MKYELNKFYDFPVSGYHYEEGHRLILDVQIEDSVFPVLGYEPQIINGLPQSVRCQIIKGIEGLSLQQDVSCLFPILYKNGHKCLLEILEIKDATHITVIDKYGIRHILNVLASDEFYSNEIITKYIKLAKSEFGNNNLEFVDEEILEEIEEKQRVSDNSEEVKFNDNQKVDNKALNGTTVNKIKQLVSDNSRSTPPIAENTPQKIRNNYEKSNDNQEQIGENTSFKEKSSGVDKQIQLISLPSKEDVRSFLIAVIHGCCTHFSKEEASRIVDSFKLTGLYGFIDESKSVNYGLFEELYLEYINNNYICIKKYLEFFSFLVNCPGKMNFMNLIDASSKFEQVPISEFYYLEDNVIRILFNEGEEIQKKLEMFSKLNILLGQEQKSLIKTKILLFEKFEKQENCLKLLKLIQTVSDKTIKFLYETKNVVSKSGNEKSLEKKKGKKKKKDKSKGEDGKPSTDKLPVNQKLAGEKKDSKQSNNPIEDNRLNIYLKKTHYDVFEEIRLKGPSYSFQFISTLDYHYLLFHKQSQAYALLPKMLAGPLPRILKNCIIYASVLWKDFKKRILFLCHWQPEKNFQYPKILRIGKKINISFVKSGDKWEIINDYAPILELVLDQIPEDYKNGNKYEIIITEEVSYFKFKASVLNK